MKSSFLYSTAIAILGAAFASPVLAQDAPDSNKIDEIVVTAQRREETVQRSSLSIQVVGASELTRKGVGSATDLVSITPSVSINQSGAYTQTNIRGVGDFSANGLAQTAVSYSVDGVVVAQPTGINQHFYDLERVEILTGPQGTLYGRNATGGAVNILTRRPTNNLEGYVTGEVGNYRHLRLTGALNIPLTDDLAIRGAFNIVDRHGYLSAGENDDVRQAGRLQAYWKPSDDFNLRLLVDYSHIGGNGPGAVVAPKQPGTGSWTSITDPINNAALSAAGAGLNPPFVAGLSRQNIKQWDATAEANIRLGDFATLTVLPGYRKLTQRVRQYTFGFDYEEDPLRVNQKTLEARIGNQSEKIKWTLGAFYFHNKASFYDIARPLVAPIVFGFNNEQDMTQTNKSFAQFGEATYSIVPEFRIIAGIRHTHDRIDFDGVLKRQFLTPAGAVGAVDIPLRGSKGFNAVTWKGGFEYDVAPNSMLYFTGTSGYKAGGFFYSPDATDTQYGPERIKAFDLGIRNRFFDNTLQVNLSAYYWMYRRQQISQIGYTTGGIIGYPTRNVGSANPYGFTSEVLWKATRADTLELSANYAHAKYKSFNLPYPAAFISTLAVGKACTVPAAPVVLPGGNAVFNIDCAGAPLPRIAKWSGAVDYSHVFELAGADKITAALGATWSTSRYLTTEFFVPETKEPGYANLHASLSYATADDRYTITAFVNNITNVSIHNGSFGYGLNGFVDNKFYFAQTIAPPRMYGLRATAKF